MSMLKPKSKEIEVLVDGEPRRFMLKARSIASQIDLLRAQEQGRLKGLKLAEKSLQHAEVLSEGMLAYIESMKPAMTMILSDPADDKPPLAEDEVLLLDTHDLNNVINEQEKLTDMTRLLGNVVALQGEAGKRILERSREDGLKLAQPSPAQVSQ